MDFETLKSKSRISNIFKYEFIYREQRLTFNTLQDAEIRVFLLDMGKREKKIGVIIGIDIFDRGIRCIA